ncbi:MAG: T9SS type A sorting domain-containing protein [Flavobacteriales bacterium]
MNDTVYKILYRSGTSSNSRHIYPFDSYVTGFSNAFAVLLREDTAQRKVYIRPELPPSELLLYDFSVGVGPYPQTYLYWNMSGLQVVAVDTLILSDGPHRRLVLSNEDLLVEGVGAAHRGLIPAEDIMHSIFYAERLVCHSMHGVHDYEDLVDVNCSCDHILGVKAATAHALQVGPSPAKDCVNVYDASPLARVRVWSMDGRMVRSGRCDQQGLATIDLAGLPATLYVVEVLDPSHPLKTKIIKE